MNVVRPDFGHAERGEAGYQQTGAVKNLKLLLAASCLMEMPGGIVLPLFTALPQGAMPICFAYGADQQEVELDHHYVVTLSLDAALQLTSACEEPATVVKCLVNEVLAPLFRQASHHQLPSYFWTLQSNLDLRNGSVRAKPGLEGRALEINLLLQVPEELEQKVKETLDRQSGSVRIAYGHDDIGDRGFGVADKAFSDMGELQALQHVLKWGSVTGASEDVRSAAQAFYEHHIGKFTGAYPR